jgi:pilus assembly protein Flp/PilA
MYMKWKKFLNDCSGATAIEYALIGSLISVAIVSGAGTLGTNLNTSFQNTAAIMGG